MSRTTLLLIVTLFASVAVHSVSSVAADSFALTNSSFYKEKGSGVLVPAGDASLATSPTTTGINRGLIAGKNSKTNYYVYQTNVPTDTTKASKGGVTTVVFRKVDVNKIAFVDGAAAVTVTGFKWAGDEDDFLSVGASVKNNVTLVGILYADPAIDNPIANIYAYVIDLDKNEKTEVLVASSVWTSNTDKTDVNILGIHINGALTTIIYSTLVQKDTSRTLTYYIVTLKGTTLGTPTTVKQISYTSGSAHEEHQDNAATGENLYIVTQTYTTTDGDNFYTETVYPFVVKEKEITAGSSAIINANNGTTNTYSFKSIHAHPDGRWVAVYSNETGDAAPYTNNLVAKSSNDTTGFKTLISGTNPTGTSNSQSAVTYFGGLVVFNKQSTDSAGVNSQVADTFTYTYQTFGGDLAALGAKTTYLATSGTKYQYITPIPFRLGDNKAINVLVNKLAYNDSATPAFVSEGLYFGQLFDKTFGATLQSVLAVSSFMLAALFFF